MTISLDDSPHRHDLPALEAWCRTLHHQLLVRRQRACLWISGDDPSDAAQAICALWPAREPAPLWLGTGDTLSSPGAPPMQALAMGKAGTRLGGEQSLVIFDAAALHGGFDPDALGAVAGTLKAGGLLVLLTPASWAVRDPSPEADGDYARLAHWPCTREALPARYLARLARRLSAHAGVLHWTHDGPLPAPALHHVNPAPRPGVISDRDCLTHDQAASVAALKALAPGRPVVISADRGRGKSGAMGIAAARCLAAGEDVWLTAPRPAAVSTIFERLAALLPRGQREGNVFRLPAAQADARDQAGHPQGDTAVGSELRFVAPDAIEAARLACQDAALPRLFVDEAAAIPTPLLKGFLADFPRIAFATTVHGYEGTGRGFQLRFRHYLERRCPGWQALEMTAPVRWALGDPLEALTDDLLLLSAQPPELPGSVTQGTATDAWLSDSEVVVLDRDALARDEAALRQLFGLLVQAHYRTTPADLRQLLDTPGLILMAIRRRDATTGRDAWLGVVAAVEEGGFPSPLAHDIWCGQRRPRGHLLAQSLAAHAGHQAAAEARWWRVLRIAVHPGLWRQGQGARLLEALERQALAAGVTRLGTSFGAEAELLAFWLAQGFVALRMGLKRDAASGEHAVMMGKAIGEGRSGDAAFHTQGEQDALLGALQQDFQRLLPSLLRHELRGLPPALADSLTRAAGDAGLAALTADECAQRLEWYRRGGGGLALVRPWLESALAAGGPSGGDDASAHGLKLALGGQDAPVFVSWADEQGIVGRKARDRWCRAAVGRLIARSAGKRE